MGVNLDRNTLTSASSVEPIDFIQISNNDYTSKTPISNSRPHLMKNHSSSIADIYSHSSHSQTMKITRKSIKQSIFDKMQQKAKKVNFELTDDNEKNRSKSTFLTNESKATEDKNIYNKNN